MVTVADETKVEPVSDEAIDNLVRFVESAELFAKAMDVPTTAQAARMLLKAMQIMVLRQQVISKLDATALSRGKSTVQ